MKKINRQSGFSVLGVVLGMVIVLVVLGGGGYLYLQSQNSVGSSNLSENFPTPLNSEDEFKTEQNSNTQLPSSPTESLESQISGENCGEVLGSDLINNPIQGAHTCMGKALLNNCSQAFYTEVHNQKLKTTYVINGVKNSDCSITTSALSCSVPIGSPSKVLDVYKQQSEVSGKVTTDSEYNAMVWGAVSNTLLSEGSNKRGPVYGVNLDVTCVKK